MAARDELVAAIAGRYAQRDRAERGWILDAFTAVTGFHRKHAIPKKRGRGLKRHLDQPLRATSDEALGDAAVRLQAREAKIAACADFAALHRLIRAAIVSIAGIGELAVYDIAHRIGAYTGLHPTEIYLHAGTRKGAKALGLLTNGKSLPITSLPADLRSLSAEEAEDLLCIYRKTLARIRGTVGTVMKPS